MLRGNLEHILVKFAKYDQNTLVNFTCQLELYD